MIQKIVLFFKITKYKKSKSLLNTNINFYNNFDLFILDFFLFHSKFLNFFPKQFVKNKQIFPFLYIII